MSGTKPEMRWVSDSGPPLNIRQFVPDRPYYAERIPEKQWKKARPDLEHLHGMGVSRAKMLEVLEHTHGFRPTLNQLNARMISWGYRVHIAQRLTQNLLDGKNKASGSRRKAIQTNSDDVERPIQGGDDDIEMHTTVDTAANDQLPTNIVRFGDAKTIEEATGYISSSESVMNVAKLIETRVFQQLKISTHLDESGSFCILYDMAEFLAHSVWYNHYACLLARALIRSVRKKMVALTGLAHLFLIRDCLYWSSARKDESMLNLISRHLQDVEDDTDYDKDETFQLALSECHSAASDIEWQVEPGSEKHRAARPGPSMLSQFVSIHNPLLCSIGHTLVVRSGAEYLPGSLSHWIMPGLTKWCMMVVKRFQAHLNNAFSASEYSSDRLQYHCHTQLTRFFLQRWIQHVNHAVKQLGTKTCSASCNVSQVSLFKFIAQGLATLSYHATERASPFFKSVPTRYDIEHPDWLRTSNLTHQITEVLASAVAELHTSSNVDLRPSPTKTTSTEIGSQEQDLLEDVIKVSSIIAQEFHHVRQNPRVRRHCVGLDLPAERGRKENFGRSVSPDAMLVDSGTSSSLSSFCTAAIKVKDKFGPASASSGSSIFSRVFREHCSDVITFRSGDSLDSRLSMH